MFAERLSIKIVVIVLSSFLVKRAADQPQANGRRKISGDVKNQKPKI